MSESFPVPSWLKSLCFLECMALTAYPALCCLAFGSVSLVVLEGGAESALIWGHVWKLFHT